MPRQAGDCRIYREVTAYAPLRNVSRGLHGVTQSTDHEVLYWFGYLLDLRRYQDLPVRDGTLAQSPTHAHPFLCHGLYRAYLTGAESVWLVRTIQHRRVDGGTIDVALAPDSFAITPAILGGRDGRSRCSPTHRLTVDADALQAHVPKTMRYTSHPYIFSAERAEFVVNES